MRNRGLLLQGADGTDRDWCADRDRHTDAEHNHSSAHSAQPHNTRGLIGRLSRLGLCTRSDTSFQRTLESHPPFSDCVSQHPHHHTASCASSSPVSAPMVIMLPSASQALLTSSKLPKSASLAKLHEVPPTSPYALRSCPTLHKPSFSALIEEDESEIAPSTSVPPPRAFLKPLWMKLEPIAE
jgi:hypothetical protein